MSYHNFEDLDVWKRSTKLAVEVYGVLSACKDYGLKDQMQRAAVSIASNIAEGAERGSQKDFARFLHIAKGSAAELRTQLEIAFQINIVDLEIKTKLKLELIEISKMLQGLIKHLTLNT